MHSAEVEVDNPKPQEVEVPHEALAVRIGLAGKSPHIHTSGEICSLND